MATQPLAETFVEAGSRGAPGSYEYVGVVAAAAGATYVTIVPFAGKLVRAIMTAGSLHNVTNNFVSVKIENKSNSDALMMKPAENDTGDGTDTLTYDVRVLTLTTTKADLLVSEGDYLELTTIDVGTLTANTHFTLIYEID